MHLDVDGPFFVDIEMGIWTIGGTLLANNDDNGLDPGSTSVQDPAIFNLSLAAGDDIVGLCRYNCVFQSGSPYMTASPGGSGGGVLPNGTTYTLNISANAVPEPLSLGLTGIGLMLLGLQRMRR